MEIAGTTTVASAPPRPGQEQVRIVRRRPDELSKQMTHFRNGERKQRSVIRGRVKRRRGERAGGGGDPCLLLSTDPGQERMRQHHERDMAIPPDPAADFVVVQTQLFGLIFVFLNMEAVLQWP